MHKMHICMHLVCYIRCGCHKFSCANQNKFCVLCYLEMATLEVVTNLCFVTLMDVSKHICELLLIYLYINTNLCFTVSILWHNLVPCLQ